MFRNNSGDGSIAVRALTYSEYLLRLSERRTPLSDYYAKQTQNGFGSLFALVSEEAILSFLILDTASDVCHIVYVETDAHQRCKGFATELIRAVMEKKDVPYRMNITSIHPYYRALKSLVEKLGFFEHSSSTVYTAQTDAEMWKRMDALSLERMEKLFLDRGFVCVSFRDCSQSQMQAIRDSDGSAFENPLRTRDFLENAAKSTDLDLSFALFQGDTLFAYTLVTRPNARHVNCIRLRK